MNFEEKVFEKRKIDLKKVEKYGFKRIGNVYIYEKEFLENKFKAVITVDLKSNITGKIIDLDFGDEYTNYRVEDQIGEFVGRVRQEYKEILIDIREKCSESLFFKYSQANRISNLIYEKYGDVPAFPWDDSNGVFKNKANNKWYGIIMKIDKSKLNKSENKEVEVLNVKLDKDEINELIAKDGYYRAYHMNKTYWVTICLDDTLKDTEIMEKVEKSHIYTETINEWILPANPKLFDIIRIYG